MNADYTHTSILLDASGSMNSIKSDTIGGINEFIDEQKKNPGKMTVTLAQFSSSGHFSYLHNMADIASVNSLTEKDYFPSGTTALLDSAARLIKDTGVALAALPEAERPAKVVITIITDGEENASIETTKKALAEMIKHQEETYNWNFSYIGANQDSFSEAGSFGMSKNIANFDATTLGTKKLYKGMSASYTSYRGADAGTLYKLSQDDIDNADVDTNSTTTNP